MPSGMGARYSAYMRDTTYWQAPDQQRAAGIDIAGGWIRDIARAAASPLLNRASAGNHAPLQKIGTHPTLNEPRDVYLTAQQRTRKPWWAE